MHIIWCRILDSTAYPSVKFVPFATPSWVLVPVAKPASFGPAHWAQGPLGPGPVWSQGPFGPGARLGPGPIWV